MNKKKKRMTKINQFESFKFSPFFRLMSLYANLLEWLSARFKFGLQILDSKVAVDWKTFGKLFWKRFRNRLAQASRKLFWAFEVLQRLARR